MIISVNVLTCLCCTVHIQLNTLKHFRTFYLWIIKINLREKFEVYEEAGVNEYWVGHPQEQTLLVYTLDQNGKYITYKNLTSVPTKSHLLPCQD